MRRLSHLSKLSFLAVLATAVGCQTPSVEPIRSVPLRPQSQEDLKLDHLVVIIDSSGSIDRTEIFPQQKAVIEGFVASLPAGDYHASQVAFGGYERQIVEHTAFDRVSLAEGAASLSFLDDATQLDRVLVETQEVLKDTEGAAALVIFTDGLPTAPGGWREIPEETLEAARELVASRPDPTCFFTVQSGEDEAGAAFLQELSQVTPCGNHRSIEGMEYVPVLHAFTRKVFLGEQLPAVAAAAPAGDADGDGVMDAYDDCPGTPLGAEVGADGCWSAPTIFFELGSHYLPQDFEPKVESVYQVLAQNPAMSVRIDGYTDSSGSEELNETLSMQRAQSAAMLLEAKGVESHRIVVLSHGEQGAPFPNDTPENRAANRRIDFAFLQ